MIRKGTGYDANGNVTQKIGWPNLTTTYAYDALNRVASKSYSDSTPAVTYSYDQDRRLTGDSNPNYPLGHLTGVANAVSTTVYNRFDAAGRAAVSTQTTGGQNYTFGYSYDLSGALLAETFPSGRLLTDTYDAAGREASITGTKTGETAKPYVQAVTYAPHGAMQNVQLGNGLWENALFNSRLQSSWLGLGTSNTDTSVARFDFQYNLDQSGNCAGTGTNNNGSVTCQTITAPGAAAFTQTYGYDAVNRLASAAEGSAWSRNWQYDQYGNGWLTAYTGIGIIPNLTPTSGSNYQASTNMLNLASFTYLPSGEVLAANGVNYT